MYIIYIYIIYIHVHVIYINDQYSFSGVRKSGEYWDLSRVPHLLTHTLSLQKFKQKKDDCPARLSAAAAEEEEISSPPDLSVTRRFDFAEPHLSATECHAPASCKSNRRGSQKLAPECCFLS